MITAESMSSKRQITMKKIAQAQFFLFRLFFSHYHCVQNALFVIPKFYQAQLRNLRFGPRKDKLHLQIQKFVNAFCKIGFDQILVASFSWCDICSGGL